MSLNIKSTLAVRRPTLLRVWRTNGTQLTSRWVPTLTPNTSLTHEGGPRP